MGTWNVSTSNILYHLYSAYILFISKQFSKEFSSISWILYGRYITFNFKQYLKNDLYISVIPSFTYTSFNCLLLNLFNHFGLQYTDSKFLKSSNILSSISSIERSISICLILSLFWILSISSWVIIIFGAKNLSVSLLFLLSNIVLTSGFISKFISLFSLILLSSEI